MRLSHLQLPLLLALMLPAAAATAQQGPGAQAKVKELELEEVREQISELKKSMDRRAAERDRITAELQQAEVAIAKKRSALRDIERERDRSEAKKARIEADIADSELALADESRQLASQVKAAYMSGVQDRIKLILNQQDPADLGRQLKYYEYLSDYRAGNIDRVTEEIRSLGRLRSEASAEASKLARLSADRASELDELDSAQLRRRELLASLNTRLEAEGSAIERLVVQERDLARLIAELTSILSDYPITSEAPFSELKGQLTWPVAGRVIHRYGDARAAGQLKWNGVVVAAPRGREVRSVYHGRVVFADWLAGMGLLVIVDHGEGYMTLYGYNETLLKSAGDWVAPGDVIATVGDSGGQADAGLYFEVRQGTTPVNPRSWVSRQPKS